MGDQKETKNFSLNQRRILCRRGLDPNKYIFVKEYYGTLYVRNIESGKIKIINKYN